MREFTFIVGSGAAGYFAMGLGLPFGTGLALAVMLFAILALLWARP